MEEKTPENGEHITSWLEGLCETCPGRIWENCSLSKWWGHQIQAWCGIWSIVCTVLRGVSGNGSSINCVEILHIKKIYSHSILFFLIISNYFFIFSGQACSPCQQRNLKATGNCTTCSTWSQRLWCGWLPRVGSPHSSRQLAWPICWCSSLTSGTPGTVYRVCATLVLFITAKRGGWNSRALLRNPGAALHLCHCEAFLPSTTKQAAHSSACWHSMMWWY